MSRIFITGATGTIGRYVVEQLLSEGHKPKIGLRSPEKGQEWAEKGAEIVLFDYDKPDTLSTAMRGTDTLFLLTPFVEHFVPMVKSALGAAKEAGVKHIVRLSVVGSDPDAQGPPHQHGICDTLIKESGLDWTLIQPTFFQDNILNFAADTIKHQGAIYGAAGDGKTAYVSAKDIASVSVAVLKAPEKHIQQAYPLTGPEALSEYEVAAIVSEITGKEVRYTNLTREHYIGGMKHNQLPEWMIQYMTALEDIKANGWAAGLADGVQKVTGQAPRGMRAYLTEQKHRLTS